MQILQHVLSLEYEDFIYAFASVLNASLKNMIAVYSITMMISQVSTVSGRLFTMKNARRMPGIPPRVRAAAAALS